MIEIPEAMVLAEQLQKTLTGKTIHSLTANANPHGFAWFEGDPASYPDKFIGKSVTGAYAYGGKLHLSLTDDCGFMFCDGISLRYITNEKKLPKKHQLFFNFGDGTYLTCSVCMYGCLFGHEGELRNNYDVLARNAPSVLSDAFSLEHLMDLSKNVKQEKTSVKALLATAQRIPGFGNGVLQDVLFLSGLHPKRKVETLERQDYENLLYNMKRTLAQMTELGGRDVETDIFGEKGRYKTLMSRNTYRAPCPKCGGVVVKEAYLGGSVYYCPTCQKL